MSERTQPMTWVDWFLNESGYGRYFVAIDQSFLKDTFNFYGLRGKVAEYSHALELIRGNYVPPDQRPQEWSKDIDKNATRLYGLLHSRFLITSSGLEMMHKKYRSNSGLGFETCPRYACKGTRCLPYGIHEEINQGVLHLFCPRCHEIYTSEDEYASKIDGAYFGPSWVLLYFQQYHDELRAPMIHYEPKLFGFRIDLVDESTESDSECSD